MFGYFCGLNNVHILSVFKDDYKKYKKITSTCWGDYNELKKNTIQGFSVSEVFLKKKQL